MSTDPHRPAWLPRSVVDGPAESETGAAGEGARPARHVSSEDDATLADEFAVRPFLLTGGRTRPARDDLRVESLVQAVPGIPVGTLRFEGRRIYDLCRRAASVADLAAALRVPLGVTRVLVCDLIADGHVTLVASQAISVQLLERIRDRVRAL
jgi:Protein of unknown function (DUF742)